MPRAPSISFKWCKATNSSTIWDPIHRQQSICWAKQRHWKLSLSLKGIRTVEAKDWIISLRYTLQNGRIEVASLSRRSILQRVHTCSRQNPRLNSKILSMSPLLKVVQVNPKCPVTKSQRMQQDISMVGHRTWRSGSPYPKHIKPPIASPCNSPVTKAHPGLKLKSLNPSSARLLTHSAQVVRSTNRLLWRAKVLPNATSITCR